MIDGSECRYSGQHYFSSDLEDIGFIKISDISWSFGPKHNNIYPIVYTEQWTVMHGTTYKARDVYLFGMRTEEFPTLEMLAPIMHYVIQKCM